MVVEAGYALVIATHRARRAHPLNGLDTKKLFDLWRSTYTLSPESSPSTDSGE